MKKIKERKLFNRSVWKAIQKGGSDIDSCRLVIDLIGFAVLHFEYHNSPGRKDGSTGEILTPLTKEIYLKLKQIRGDNERACS